MTKKSEGTALAVVEPAGALAVPSFITDYAGAGTENLDRSRIRPPQLKICQSKSRERTKGDDRYIAGLEEPNMFNTATKEVYGDGPLEFVVIKTLGERAMEFNEAFEVVDRNVPVTRKGDRYVDPRLNWDDTKEGKDAKPTATVFREYLILLLNTDLAPEMVTISFSGTGLRAANDLDRLIAYPLKVNGKMILKPPSFARVFQLSTTMDKKDGNSFSVYRLTTKGIADAATGAAAAGLYEEYRNTVIDVEVEDGAAASDVEGDDPPF